jgi:hypothetical protein
MGSENKIGIIMSRTHRDGGFGSGWEQFERKRSTKKERARKRAFCYKAKYDEETTMEEAIENREPMWCKGWTGYWRPMRRWLASRAGQPWNQVYSELIAKIKTFSSTQDEKSIRRSIVNLVEITPDPRFGDQEYYYRCCYPFYVDDEGILQIKKTKPKQAKTPKCNLPELANWLNGRVVGRVGNKLYWFLPVTKNKKHGQYSFSDKWVCQWGYGSSSYYSCAYYGLRYLYLVKEYIFDNEGKIFRTKEKWKEAYGMITRQHRKFTPEEEAYWNKIPKFYQDKILKFSPIRGDFTGH